MIFDLSPQRGIRKVAIHFLLVCGLALNASGPALAALQPAARLEESTTRASVVEITTDADIGEVATAERAPAAEGDWPMAGANPQRTSWTTEEVRGTLSPVWYRPIEPFISQKTQIIAANNLLYVSTAAGLYALNADNGSTAWVFPTELPLGHSPTIYNGVAYVGGLDHRLYAINALTGAEIWSYEADRGFETNPLVVELGDDTYIFTGNRDGSMYALRDLGSSADLAWKYETGGPILYSAAYKNNVLYFASNDAYAYALNATTGGLVWRSAKLLGAGFQSWWPVIYTDPQTQADYVWFAGSNNYRFWVEPGTEYDMQQLEIDDLYKDNGIPVGATIAPINQNDVMDASKILNYYYDKPWRRTVFVLSAATGTEYRFGYGSSGRTSYAPITWLHTHGAGNRYPPVIGSDGVAYMPMHYEYSNPYIAHGGIVGWELGDSFVTAIGPDEAMDEPMAYSAGGNLIYWVRNNDRKAGAFDVTLTTSQPNREWVYFDYNLEDKIPGYDAMFYDLPGTTDSSVYQGAGNSSNGVYGLHGEQNAPIPYNGRVYMHRSNAIIAFGSYSGSPNHLAAAETLPPTSTTPPSVSSNDLLDSLAEEVEKMLDAGHLRPGYLSTGLFDIRTKQDVGDYLLDYWHSPADTIYVLLLALPYLPSNLAERTKTYIQNEMNTYPPYQYSHVGWNSGVAREAFSLPPEVDSDRANFTPMTGNYGYEGWTIPPYTFYALWKYAETFGGAASLFAASRNKLESPPSNSYLLNYPYVHNAYIAGYIGYLELEKLAGQPESAAVRNTLNNLLALRASNFSTSIGDAIANTRPLSVARNFMYMVPELGEYLHDHAYSAVSQAMNEYETIAPYWFVSRTEQTAGEGVIQPLYDTNALFQAKALIFGATRAELIKYLDVPAFPRGDLFYIQNLVTALATAPALKISASPHYGDLGDTIDFTILLTGEDQMLTLTDTLPNGLSAPFNIQISGSGVQPIYDSGQHRLTWSDAPGSGEEVTIRYSADVVTASSTYLTNLVELRNEENESTVASTGIVANPYHSFLTVVAK